MSKKSKSSSASEDISGRIIIRLWPKTPVLYPMALLALICGIVGQIFGIPHELKHHPAAPVTGIEMIDKGRVEDAVIPKVEPSEPDSVPAPESAEPREADPAPVPEPVGGAAPEETGAPESAGAGEAPAVVPMAVDAEVNAGQSGKVQTIMALLFLAMLTFSLFVVCIDFEVRWFMVGLVVVLMIIMGLLGADKLGYIKLPGVLRILDHFTLYATPLFYYAIFGIWVLLMIVSATIARFHFIRIESNEVVVISGVLESQKRMSTFRMHYTKEIQDVFEYWLPFVRSGRIIFTFPNEEHPLVVDNVLGINKVLKQLDRSSSAFQVRGVE